MQLNNIHILIKGGLGNQLFQYAVGRVLSEKYGGKLRLIESLKINPKNTYRKFKLLEMNLNYTKFNYFYFLFHKYTRKIQIIKEVKNFKYQEIKILTKDILLDGYWQSHKYFNQHKLFLYNEFFKNLKLKKEYKKYLSKFDLKNSVALHVRRGDYVTNFNASKFHGVLDINYYMSAINFFKNKGSHCNFFIFSDDIIWCKKKLNFDNIIFIDEKNSDEIQEMKLMSLFSNFIIANSSFSWWPAFLSINHNKVVVSPKNWISENIDLSDLIPNTWHKF